MIELRDSLSMVHEHYWEPHLEYIRNKLEDLTRIVEDERFIFQNEEFIQTREHHFKSFINCRLLGPKNGDLILFGQCIRFKAVRFAEVWLEVLYESIDRLDLIHKLLLQSLAVNTESHTLSKVTGSNKNNPIKTNLNVSQIAYLFRILAKSNILDIPPRWNKELIIWITENFQSKNRESISSTSLRNKYFTPDLSAIDCLEGKFKEIIKMISTDRDHILE